MKQTEPWTKDTGNSLEEMAKEEQRAVEEAKMQLLQEREAQIQHFQEELEQEKEEEMQVLQQQQQDFLRSVPPMRQILLSAVIVARDMG